MASASGGTEDTMRKRWKWLEMPDVNLGEFVDPLIDEGYDYADVQDYDEQDLADCFSTIGMKDEQAQKLFKIGLKGTELLRGAAGHDQENASDKPETETQKHKRTRTGMAGVDVSKLKSVYESNVEATVGFAEKPIVISCNMSKHLKVKVSSSKTKKVAKIYDTLLDLFLGLKIKHPKQHLATFEESEIEIEDVLELGEDDLADLFPKSKINRKKFKKYIDSLPTEPETRRSTMDEGKPYTVEVFNETDYVALVCVSADKVGVAEHLSRDFSETLTKYEVNKSSSGKESAFFGLLSASEDKQSSFSKTDRSRNERLEYGRKVYNEVIKAGFSRIPGYEEQVFAVPGGTKIHYLSITWKGEILAYNHPTDSIRIFIGNGRYVLDEEKTSHKSGDKVIGKYENERFSYKEKNSWGAPWDHERPHWSDQHGGQDMSDYSPPEGWHWVEHDWRIDFGEENETDANGWEYAFDFNFRYDHQYKRTHYVRRRKLIRTISWTLPRVSLMGSM